MNLLARCCEEGWGAPRDPAAARDWYRRSAEAGYFRAQFNHATLLAAEGRVDDAIGWFERALAGAPADGRAAHGRGAGATSGAADRRAGAAGRGLIVLLRLPRLLTSDQVAHCREALAGAAWVDGRETAGAQSGLAKHNLQLPEDAPEAKALGDLILAALAANAAFMSAALPLKVFPPLFNRYGAGMGFGDHIDNAVRASPVTGARYRTDLSCTVFLSEPDEYDGGELVIEGGLAPARIKLPAGDAILYPATSVHRVEPVTRGERLAAFFWVQSMVADGARRALLHDLDRAIAAARADLGDDARRRRLAGRRLPQPRAHVGRGLRTPS